MLTFQEYLIEVIRIETGEEPTPLAPVTRTRKPTKGERLRAAVLIGGVAAAPVSGLVYGKKIDPTTVPTLSGINFQGLHGHEHGRKVVTTPTQEEENENDK